METPLFFIGKELSSKTPQWLYRQQIQFVEQIEQSTRTINAYLFLVHPESIVLKLLEIFLFQSHWSSQTKMIQPVLPDGILPTKCIPRWILKNFRLFNIRFSDG